jgi:hypothetical protein
MLAEALTILTLADSVLGKTEKLGFIDASDAPDIPTDYEASPCLDSGSSAGVVGCYPTSDSPSNLRTELNSKYQEHSNESHLAVQVCVEH